MEITEEPLTNSLKAIIYDGFSRHSIAETGHDEKHSPICLVARENGEFQGAVTFEIFWGALHIKYAFIEDGNRGKRLGSRLLQQAENWGREHGCTFAFLETMNFQALDFYLKNGYKHEFTRNGFSHNSSFHYLRKELL